MRKLTTPQKVLLAAGLLAFLAGTSVFVYYYVRFSRIIDARLNGKIFSTPSIVFAAPKEVYVGESTTLQALTSRLLKAGYTNHAGEPSNLGSFALAGSNLEVYPGPGSFLQGDFHEGPALISFQKGQISSISALDQPRSLQSYWLEPEIITTLFGRNRSKRLLVNYQDLPQDLIDAILAAEDHRFFSHHGVNLFRIFEAAITDLRAGEPLQGGSTLTMQLARNFFLTPRRTIRRKLAEIFMALLLEQRLTKEQIFGLYANEIYLGQRGSFSIYGVGEASRAYFNKDVSTLNLPQAALLAGLIRGPNLYSPYRYPQRALARRNYVLRLMADNGYISAAEAEKAATQPLDVTQQNVEASQAPYFVDMVKDELLSHFSEHDLLSQSYRIYTTLDLDLQKDASQAVQVGMGDVDQLLKNRRGRRGGAVQNPDQPQVALVSIDPFTGDIKALVGGRNYGVSQLNHVLARRQPGSSFKPFVYATALSSAVDGSQPVITPATLLDDEPTTFQFGGKVYQPENYKQEYHGIVTVRQALTYSLNVASVELAQMVGFDKIRQLALEAGFNNQIEPTPALALGAYVATPLEVAGGYTIFANQGVYVKPRAILAVTDSKGHTLWRSPTVTRRVLDPRVSYLMVSLLESVINHGTGAGARRRGFEAPAAGKTGTSHDGWFAGFTSNLLAVAWVGYDDDRDLNLAGASSALPVWTEFMKRAIQDPLYHDVQDFVEPPGIVSATVKLPVSQVDSGQSSSTETELFIDGTAPPQQGVGRAVKGVLVKLFGRSSNHSSSTPAPVTPAVRPSASATTAPAAVVVQPKRSGDQVNPTASTKIEPVQSPNKNKKKSGEGFVKKLFHFFTGKESKPKPPQQPNQFETTDKTSLPAHPNP